jgi:hypothetical protein
MATVDLEKPIEVLQTLTGETTAATFMRPRGLQVGRYEIAWRGRDWVVGEDHQVLGAIGAEGIFADECFVQNRLSE